MLLELVKEFLLTPLQRPPLPICTGHVFHVGSNSQSSGAESKFFQIGSVGFFFREWLNVEGPED